MPFPTDNTENSPTKDVDKKAIVETDADLKQLEQSLSQIPDLLSQNSELLGGAEVHQLLQRLTNATDMADDVEGKLDDVLAKLDALLDDLGIDATLLEGLGQEPKGSLNGKSFKDTTICESEPQTSKAQSQPPASPQKYMLQRTTLLTFDRDASAWTPYVPALTCTGNLKDTYEFRVATWNVWENEQWQHLRHPFIVDTLIFSPNQYSVIMLQEVTIDLFGILLQHPVVRSDWIITDLKEQFELCPNFYSTVILLNRSIAHDFDVFAGLIEYENTRMQRSLNIIELSHRSKPQFRFATSHFESHPEDVRKRREQFHTAALVSTSPVPIHTKDYEDYLHIPLAAGFPSVPAIVAGDCNIPSYEELDAFLLPPFSFIDGFIAAKPSAEPPRQAHPTYGMNIIRERKGPVHVSTPLCRLDYIFVHGPDMSISKEENMSGYIGDKSVCPIEVASDPKGRDAMVWASDHLGHWLSVRWDNKVVGDHMSP